MEKEYQFVAPCSVALKFERSLCPPWGIAGGAPAELCFVEIVRTNGETLKVWKGTFPLAKGDRMIIVSGGGGGYGPAREREVERVMADIEAGYITADHAADQYGVVLTSQVLLTRRPLHPVAPQ